MIFLIANIISCIPILLLLGAWLWPAGWGSASPALYSGSTGVMLFSWIAVLLCLVGWVVYFIILFFTHGKLPFQPFGALVALFTVVCVGIVFVWTN